MHFQQFAPPEPLRKYVKYFWTLECPEPGPKPLRTIADGCPGLVFQQTVGGIHDQTGKPWPALLLHGQATKATEARVGGSFRMAGASLHPSAVPAVCDLRADELTNSCLDMALLPMPDRSLAEQLQHSQAPVLQVKLLSDFLLAATTRPAHSPDPGVQHALERLLTTQGRVSLRQLQQETQLSERSLQRKFQHLVGVPPKLFARICQFQATLQQLRTARYDKLSDLAFAHEYADQSHHIRGFREFAGLSPRQYLHRSQELMENLTAPR
jgi:AraC-like DNA-binding protein